MLAVCVYIYGPQGRMLGGFFPLAILCYLKKSGGKVRDNKLSLVTRPSGSCGVFSQLFLFYLSHERYRLCPILAIRDIKLATILTLE